MGAACLATFVSCNLDMTPESTMTDDAFWKSKSDLRNACNRFYDQLNGNNALGGGFSHDYRADDLRNRNSANSTSDGSWTIPSSNGSWTDSYWRIAIANNILEKSKRANVTDAVREVFDAEARFFRGYYYFELSKKYGGVPVIEKAFSSTDDPVLMSPRNTLEETVDFAIADLQYAADKLPDIDERNNSGEWRHVSRSAALGMLVRAGLYAGTHAKYHNDGLDSKKYLKVAIDAAETMIREGKHDLYPDYSQLFTFAGEGRQNKEAVFIKEYGPNGAGTVTHGNCRQMENTVEVTRNAIDQFLYADGLPKGKSQYEVKNELRFNDILENRDPRLNMSVYGWHENDYKSQDYTPFSFGNGYDLKKGFDAAEWATNSKETIDKMIIRYAEILISYAEALYEYNGSITDTQLDATVNRLRARAGFDIKLTNSFATDNGLNMRDELRRERFAELFAEGLRYDDIIRWKIAQDVLPTSLLGARMSTLDIGEAKVDDLKKRMTTGGGMFNGVKVADQDSIYVLEFGNDRRFDTAKDYLYPVPLEEINRSYGNVVQNPGWK